MSRGGGSLALSGSPVNCNVPHLNSDIFCLFSVFSQDLAFLKLLCACVLRALTCKNFLLAALDLQTDPRICVLPCSQRAAVSTLQELKYINIILENPLKGQAAEQQLEALVCV